MSQEWRNLYYRMTTATPQQDLLRDLMTGYWHLIEVELPGASLRKLSRERWLPSTIRALMRRDLVRFAPGATEQRLRARTIPVMTPEGRKETPVNVS